MKQDKTIIIRIDDKTKKEYENLLNNNGMNLSKRLKLLIKKDIIDIIELNEQNDK